MYQAHSWESKLISLAYEALTPSAAQRGLVNDQQLLACAFEHCTELTAYHSRSFHLASRLLPTPKRRAVRALYAFCRLTDDIVDDRPQTAETELKAWRERVFSPTHPPMI